jgi:hypothetical protein
MPYTGTQATGGLGTLLSVKTGSPLAFAVIDEAKGDVNTPTQDRPKYDATNMQSTSREYILSRLADNGEIAYTCNFTASTIQQLVFDTSNTVRDFQIAMFEDDGTTALDTVTFSGYFTKATVKNPVDGIKELSFSIIVTGDVSHSF